MPLLDYLTRLVAHESLSAADAERAMDLILRGEASPAEIAGFLVALRMKGETSGELVGFARAMRRMATPIEHGLNGQTLLDTCGTGGDGCNTFNISTIAAFVVAGAGVHVAKHGNRSISSRCGSADLLEAWGVRVPMAPEETARAIREVGIGFLFAPAVHAAMKHAQPVRKDLKIRTAFNLLGPLTNPAGAQAQVLGVFSLDVMDLVAATLAELGTEHAFVVHGAGGLDEISLAGETMVAEVRDGKAQRFNVTPEEFGVKRAPIEAIRGGTAKENAALISRILEGEAGAPRDIVVINAAAALVATGISENFRDAADTARLAIDSGKACETLESLKAFTTRA